MITITEQQAIDIVTAAILAVRDILAQRQQVSANLVHDLGYMARRAGRFAGMSPAELCRCLSYHLAEHAGMDLDRPAEWFGEVAIAAKPARQIEHGEIAVS